MEWEIPYSWAWPPPDDDARVSCEDCQDLSLLQTDQKYSAGPAPEMSRINVDETPQILNQELLSEDHFHAGWRGSVAGGEGQPGEQC